MPPPTPPPLCAGFGYGAASFQPGYQGNAQRLQLKDQPPTISEAFALTHGLYRIRGVLQAYVDADYRTTYPKELPQEFKVTVRISPYHWDGPFRWCPAGKPVVCTKGEAWYENGEQPWHFERTLIATAVGPRFEAVGQLEFEQDGLPMAPGRQLQMSLVSAHWSLSPQQGRELVYTVHALMSRLELCAEGFITPSPPPLPPVPPSPPPPTPPPFAPPPPPP
eukprot:1297798-Prymnesium_polylepis.1